MFKNFQSDPKPLKGQGITNLILCHCFSNDCKLEIYKITFGLTECMIGLIFLIQQSFVLILSPNYFQVVILKDFIKFWQFENYFKFLFFLFRLMLGLLWSNLMVSILHPKSFVEYYFVNFIYKIYKDFQHTFCTVSIILPAFYTEVVKV